MDRSGSQNETRSERASRLGAISWRMLRSDRRLLVFPLISVLLSFVIASLAYALAAGVIGLHDRLALLLATTIAAYPLTLVSTLCGVALAALLSARLAGEPADIASGWAVARRRFGIIVLWSLMVCTVGALFTVLRERLPLGGRIAAWVGGISWSLATLFALPVLAYEDLGPIATLKRSGALFRERWAEQTFGIVGITAISWLAGLPFVLLLLVGLATHGAVGVALFACGGAGVVAIGAFDTAVNHVFRLFRYRDTLGLDAPGAGPFTADDLSLETLWAASRRQRWNLASDYDARARASGRLSTRHYYERR